MKRKSHVLSSSDEESTKKKSKTSLCENDNDPALFEEILKNNKVSKFNFKCLKSCNTLFYDDINSDDEVYLVQCPKNTDVTTLNNANLNFDSTISNIRCRINGTKEKLTVYSVDDFPSQLNLALPNRATKSFQLKALPVTGQLVMQKNTKTKQIKVENETGSCYIDLDCSLKSELKSSDELKSELISSTPMKKRS